MAVKVDMKLEGFECYPLWTVLVYYLISFSTYAVGLYLFYLLYPVLSLLFLVYMLYLEFSVYREGCRYCYYYGKRCVAGRGVLVKFLFKKGDSQKFCERTLSLKDFIPQILASLMPMAAGAYLLYKDFSLLIFGLTVWPIVMWVLGNPVIYGRLACPNCRQGKICCPACEFFMKKTKK